ncbi:hypothetical protein L873DRAFT_1667081 [Choiromyces venosus 120613-1]|uniref:Uncharacterized protein n=1 Tax=Choiromyces venosus 120613-1 TaxID=1336337 RepID=A0A3N4K1B9_9PEZI|nr:hypothetical protein L873DRAFT_1667081 [Choiromyces venosus 120613-1]
MPERSKNPAGNTAHPFRPNSTAVEPTQSQGVRVQDPYLDHIQTQQHQPSSGEPPSPAMTTSDVHGARSSSSSIASTSSGAAPQPQHIKLQDNEMLNRFLTLNSEEPLQFEANQAIRGGFVTNGENMVLRRVREEGWTSVSESGFSESAAESSVTLGREEQEDPGVSNEESMVE